MADGTLAIDEPNDVDKRIDAEKLTVGTTEVHRERVQVAGTGATDLAPVSGTHGLAVQPKLNYFSELALGNISNRKSVNKFGAAPDGMQTTATDVWDRADATPTQQVWLAPTAARIHTIQSSSANDVVNGTGVATVIVYYLPDWDTAETSETVAGDLNSGIAMNNAAVIIHRMKVTAQSTTTNVGGNEGTITATAAVDGTVTAAILPGNGQTEMAVYGVPSIQTALMWEWRGQIDKASGGAASINFVLRVNEDPTVQTVAFLRKDDMSVQSTGSSSASHRPPIPHAFPGPAIIKISGISSKADVDAEAGFDLEIVTN